VRPSKEIFDASNHQVPEGRERRDRDRVGSDSNRNRGRDHIGDRRSRHQAQDDVLDDNNGAQIGAQNTVLISGQVITNFVRPVSTVWAGKQGGPGEHTRWGFF
jgi:hypothetical protein